MTTSLTERGNLRLGGKMMTLSSCRQEEESVLVMFLIALLSTSNTRSMSSGCWALSPEPFGIMAVVESEKLL